MRLCDCACILPGTLIYVDFRLETPVTSIIGKEGKKSAFRDTQNHAISMQTIPYRNDSIHQETDGSGLR